MSDHKRAFPYHSAVASLDLKRRNVGDVDPGLEATQPKVFERPDYTSDQTVRHAALQYCSRRNLYHRIQTANRQYDHILTVECDQLRHMDGHPNKGLKRSLSHAKFCSLSKVEATQSDIPAGVPRSKRRGL